MNTLVFLAELEKNFVPTMIALLVICLLPWLFVIIKFGILRELRIRYFMPDGSLYKEVHYKRGEEIKPIVEPTLDGKKFVGWFKEEDLILPFEYKKMPDQNLKVYAKFED